jgi:para-aminobenzoate synthetase component 1
MENICYLNSNDGTGILTFGVETEIKSIGVNSVEKLQSFLNENKDSYIFGCLSYDLKNDIENLNSANFDGLEFPDLHFWKPKYVVRLQKENYIFLQGEKNAEIFDFLNYFLEEETDANFHKFDIQFQSRTSKENYIQNVNKLKESIQRGDSYEVNYCQEFFAENVNLKYPLDTYFKLNNISKAPFSGFLQLDDYLVFCGSPERYLQKKENKLISQPIKGTAARNEDSNIDEQNKIALENSPKERSENVMIVDLVRNDFSKIAQKGSVNVEELCKVYSFTTVHQMISTIACEPKDTTSFTDIIRATFPMGSMTGAPKVSAMELIEEHEDFKRGDFDFNVVIRSLIYNRKTNYLSCAVGGAITIQSDPEAEFEECQIKVKKIMDGLHDE